MKTFLLNNRLYWLLILCLGIDFCLLLGMIEDLSVSYYEALNFFEGQGLEAYLARLGVKILGQNDIGLKIPFVLLNLINAVLLFFYAKGFLKRESDALVCVILFLLLPGVNAGAILLHKSGIVIFFILLLCLWNQKTQKIPYWLLLIMVFVDKSFSLVFFALIFYGIAKKNNLLIVCSLVFFALNMYLYGLEVSGRPEGYFLDTSGHLLLIFSPLMFLYFLYTLYRYINTKPKPLIWYICVVALSFILLFSLRQRVDTQTFAPLLTLGIVMMVNLYFSGLRVRLPQFKSRYRVPFAACLAVLLLCSGILFAFKPLFLVMDSFQSHFAYRYYGAKELANSLKALGIQEVKTNERLQESLKFYGISEGGRHLGLTPAKNAHKIPIKYYGKTLVTFYLE